MNLFVDDIREPFKGWIWAKTITEAIRILATTPIEIVSLDHDIMQSISGDRELETFEPVARYIALMRPSPVVWFHTGNIEAGRRMYEIVGDYCPFESLRADYALTKKRETNPNDF